MVSQVLSIEIGYSLTHKNLPILRIKIFLAILQEQKGFFGLPNIVIFRRSLKHRVAIKVLNH